MYKSEKKSKILVREWNNILDQSVDYNVVEKSNTYINLFNNYLDKIIIASDMSLSNDVCLCEKTNTYYKLYFVEDDHLKNENISLKNKRKFFNMLVDFDIIIIKDMSLDNEAFKNKVVLRYNIITSFLSNGQTHFFSKELPFSINDYTVFFTNIFLSFLKNNEERYNLIKHASFLLNSFETGISIDDFILKPIISISTYGRWYWSNTKNIQTNIAVRKSLYRKLSKYGNIYNLDFISAEPMILSNIINSELIKKIVKLRILLKSNNIEMSTSIKNMLNIYIHSIDNPKKAYNKFKEKNDVDNIEKLLKISILDILNCLQDDFLWYNSNVIVNYKKDLYVDENYRRIVNPYAIIQKDYDIIKEHRKYLQGHVHDKILELSLLLYKNLNLIPLFTIHDSLTYFNYVDTNNNIITKDDIIKNIKKIKMPTSIECIEK